MNIGDKVSFYDKIYFKTRYGFIKKFNKDQTKAMVSIHGQFSHRWMKVEDITKEETKNA
jgi:hypothetical protein